MANSWDYFDPNKNSSNLDIELLKKEVGTIFPFMI